MVTATEPQPRAKPKTNVVVGNVISVRYDAITPDPDQPRKVFDEDGIKELAQSMDSNGLLQPISIRPDEENSTTRDKRYIIIAGERRWRAAGSLGWETIPAIIRKGLSAEETVKLQLLENIVRRDLNPLEEAQALGRLLDEGYTLKDLSQALGRPTNRIQWRVEILRLAPDILKLVGTGELDPSIAHAISKCPPDRQHEAFRIIANGNMKYTAALMVCERIIVEENQTELFEEILVTEEQREAVVAFDRLFKQVCQSIAKCEEVEARSPGSLATAIAHESTVAGGQLDEAIRGLGRIKRLLDLRAINQLVTEAA